MMEEGGGKIASIWLFRLGSGYTQCASIQYINSFSSDCFWGTCKIYTSETSQYIVSIAFLRKPSYSCINKDIFTEHILRNNYKVFVCQIPDPVS